jgi:hypothetical protein
MMIKKCLVLFLLVLLCMPVYARKDKLKVYPNPWIPESGKSLYTDRGDEMKHGAYTADGWIKFEGVNAGNTDNDNYGGTLRIYDITGHLIRYKSWTIGEECNIPLPKTSDEWINPKHPQPPHPKPKDYTRERHIVHWDGRNNDNDHVESGVYIWIITEDDGSKYDGKVVVVR